MAVLSLALLGFFGCRTETVDVDNVTIRPASVELTKGSTYQLSAVVMPSDAPQELVWTSSRPAVASINASGLVTAIAIGECDITVYASNKSDVCHVRVVNGDPTCPQDPTDTMVTDIPTDPTDTTENPIVVGFDQNGASNSVFTVASGRTVHFSRGNLQYQASTGIWRFAEYQYDYVGNGNNNISSTYTGWIDEFGWGTSGWNSGANAYQPWNVGTSYSDFYPGGSSSNNLTGVYANADWGVYNAISNGGNRAGMWRTLTKDEWSYLLFSRAASTINGETNARYVKAIISGTCGLIIFPDYFTMPSGISYPSGINNGSESSINNSYTKSQWSKMEGAGCIFLPAAGMSGAAGANGYWSSTHQGEMSAYYMLFHEYYGVSIDDVGRGARLSVRLVSD